MGLSLLSVMDFVGRFHPVLVHLPIGILLIGLLLQVLSQYPASDPRLAVPPAIMKTVLLAGMLSALLSCFTGYLLSLSGGYEEGLVTGHMWMGIGVWMLSMLLLAYQPTGNPTAQSLTRQSVRDQQSRARISRLLSVLLLIAILITGHLGGSLTHGSDYLTAALHNSAAPVVPSRKSIPEIQEAKAYADVIQPILQANCYSCHGKDKQKGSLRLDDSSGIVKGGKDGHEEIMKRILLTLDDEHHMPPKEKKQLNESDIALLQWWMGLGMDFSRKVKELPHTGRVGAYLLLLQDDQGSGGAKAPSLVPATPVEPAAEKDLAALRALRVEVLPLAKGTHYLSANFINARKLTEKDLSLLTAIRKQLVELKLPGRPIGDSALNVIAQCKALASLDVSHTLITDKGLAALKELTGLRILNLVGDSVSTQGIQSLAPLGQLQSLFLYQTQVSGRDWPTLKKYLPKTTIDTGGYTVPMATIDTANEMRPKK